MNVHTSNKLQENMFDVKCVACWSCRPINRYRIEIMYVNYIYMEIYVFVHINIFFHLSIFYV